MSEQTTTATPDSIHRELAALGPADAPERHWQSARERVVHVVTRRLFDHWHAAGVRSGDVDAQGVPHPIVGTREHDGRLVAGLTSPSGKQLFVCARCGYTSPLPRAGDCKGLSFGDLHEPVVAFLLAGGRFELDAAGVLRPTVLPRGLTVDFICRRLSLAT